MYQETHTLTIVKHARRSLQEKVIDSNAETLRASVQTKALAVRGWSFEQNRDESNGQWWLRVASTQDGYEHMYVAYWTLNFERRDDQQPAADEFASIVRTIDKRTKSPAFGSWDGVFKVDGERYEPPVDGDPTSSHITKDLVGYGDVQIPANWTDHFSHLFGLGAHVKRIMLALEASQRSDWTRRFHSVLIGDPGCGKSDICKTIKAMLGDEAVWELDATATTAAGAIKALTERETLPRVIVIEEIEKGDEDMTKFLLALLDLRGEVRKTTARTAVQRDTKVVCIATVNNEAKFSKMNAGALASRFTNKIHFSRPSRETLALILDREVTATNGDLRWIEKALDYCEEHDITDPRMVISICLVGADLLLSGEYQEMLHATSAEMNERQEKGVEVIDF